ncbi:MAG: hypothetical protein H7Z19_12740 [Chitinophagaceae bacterium]|nr:hypothetical protein [Rubrivivax sp.]
MLDTRIVRELLVDKAAGAAGKAHLSAASGVVRIGKRLFVVADDEHDLAMFDLSNGEPGLLLPIFDGELPPHHEARKAAKPDCETLLALPAFGGFPHGALMAMGSGSRPSRRRGVVLALDVEGAIRGPLRSVDLTALLAPLHDHFPDLNIEGAFVDGDTLAFLQRGNGGTAVNARIDFHWRDLQRWLAGAGAAPGPVSITRFELGAIDGVPLSFTDGACLPGGDWLFSAAAEDTSDSYRDGVCAGSAIGLVDAGGRIKTLERLSRTCKVEGVAALVSGDTIELLLVTDADDRSKPALLLSAEIAMRAGSQR